MQQFLNRLLGQLGAAVKELDTNGWTVVVAILLVCGWFFLRGDKIRST